MVHLVLLRAALPWQLANVTNTLRQSSNGFYVLGEGSYLVVTETGTQPLRDWLRTLGATQVSVLRLEGGWGTYANDELAGWLRTAATFF